MFTGIIEELGTVKAVKKGAKSAELSIEGNKIFNDIHLGDSIAVNGVCLTVTEYSGSIFKADVMNETLMRSSLGSLKTGSKVNIERAMAANGRFGGHIVSGHIDGTGVISDLAKDDIAVWVTIKTKPEILHLIVEKGSIAIDGISLTVARVSEIDFAVSIIPHTGANTTLLMKNKGDVVNLENDIIGKYIEKLSGLGNKQEAKSESRITREFLTEYGF